MPSLKHAFQKALARGLSPSNILSYCALTLPNLVLQPYSTLVLYLKAYLLGVTLGRGVTAHGPVGLLRWPGGRIVVGDNVHFISTWRRATAATLAAPVRLRVFGQGTILLGDGTELSGTSITARSTTIALGTKVLVGPNCCITDSDFHAPWPAEHRAEDPGLERDAPVTIGDYAWIGMRSLILKGVHIGRGAIIGAGSVVTRDIPENCVACGVPARVVGYAPKERVS